MIVVLTKTELASGGTGNFQTYELLSSKGGANFLIFRALFSNGVHLSATKTTDRVTS